MNNIYRDQKESLVRYRVSYQENGAPHEATLNSPQDQAKEFIKGLGPKLIGVYELGRSGEITKNITSRFIKNPTAQNSQLQEIA